MCNVRGTPQNVMCCFAVSHLHTHVTLSLRRNKKHRGKKNVRLIGKGHKIRCVIEIKSDKLFAT